jgi:hypothetical protein
VAQAPFTIKIESLPKDEGGRALQAEVVFRDEHPDQETLHSAHLALEAALEAEHRKRLGPTGH